MFKIILFKFSNTHIQSTMIRNPNLSPDEVVGTEYIYHNYICKLLESKDEMPYLEIIGQISRVAKKVKMKLIKTNEYDFSNQQVRRQIIEKRNTLRIKYKMLHHERVRVKRLKLDKNQQRKFDKESKNDPHFDVNDLDSDDDSIHSVSDDELFTHNSVPDIDIVKDEMSKLMNPIIGKIICEKLADGTEVHNILEAKISDQLLHDETIVINPEIIKLQDRLRIIDREDSDYSDNLNYWKRKARNASERITIIDEIRTLSKSNKELRRKELRSWLEDFAFSVYKEYKYCKEFDLKMNLKRQHEEMLERQRNLERQKQLKHIVKTSPNRITKKKRGRWRNYKIPDISSDDLKRFQKVETVTPKAIRPLDFKRKTKLLRNWVTSVLMYLSSGIITAGLYWVRRSFFFEFKRLLWIMG